MSTALALVACVVSLLAVALRLRFRTQAPDQPPRDWPTPLEGDLSRLPKFQNFEPGDHAGLNSPEVEHVHA